MKLVIQRVLSASVQVAGQTISQIDSGLLVLVGFETGDGIDEMELAKTKLVNGRFFENENGKPHYSCLELQKPILLVSQFTLSANLKEGRRPDFTGSMKAQPAREMFESFVLKLKQAGINVSCGEFGAYMQVHAVGDGPFTLLWSST